MKESAKKKGRTGRIILITAMILAVLLVAMLVFQGILRKKLTQLIENSPLNIEGRSYGAEIGHVRVSLAGRSVTLTDVKVKPRGRLLQQTGPAPEMELSVKELSLDGIWYKRGKDGKKPSLSVRSIELFSPHISYSGIPGSHRESPVEGASADSLSTKGLAGVFDSFSIGSLYVADGSVAYSHWPDNYKETWNVLGVYAEISDMELVPAPGQESRALSGSSVTAKADNISRTYKNDAVTMIIGGISASTSAGTLSVASFRILPHYPKDKYAATVHDHSDWTEVKFKGISASGVDYSKLQNDKTFRADSLYVKDGSIESYKNRQIAQASRIKPMLYETVWNLSMGLDIPHVHADQMYIRYDELAESADEPGMVDFKAIKMDVTGLTNRPENPKQTYRIDARGMLMGKGRIRLVMDLPAAAGNDFFKVSARMGDMELAAMNPTTEPLGNLKIESGRMTSAEVMISGTSVKADARTTITYEDLKISLLRSRDHTRRGLISFIANETMVKSSNPNEKGLRSGDGSYDRDPERSFYNYLWKTFYQSLKPIVI